MSQKFIWSSSLQLHWHHTASMNSKNFMISCIIIVSMCSQVYSTRSIYVNGSEYEKIIQDFVGMCFYPIGHSSRWSPTNACSEVRGRDWLSYHAGCQEVGRCHTRGESLESVICMPPPRLNKAAHSGLETQRRHNKKLKTGVQNTGSIKKTYVF